MASKIRQIIRENVKLDVIEADQGNTYMFTYKCSDFAKRIGIPFAKYLEHSRRFQYVDRDSTSSRAVFRNELASIFLNKDAGMLTIHCNGKLRLRTVLEDIFGENDERYKGILEDLGIKEEDVVLSSDSYLAHLNPVLIAMDYKRFSGLLEARLGKSNN